MYIYITYAADET